MGTGRLPNATLRVMADAALDVSGDFAEIGVYRGQCFQRLVPAAMAQGKLAHAFDSFAGLSEPSNLDGEGFACGALSCDLDEFRALMESAGVSLDDYRTWPGWIPACLYESGDLCLSLCYIDVDHYEPTRAAIHWAWPRLSPGGVLAFDDYFPGRDVFASPAIESFLRDHGAEVENLSFDNNQLVLRKSP